MKLKGNCTLFRYYSLQIASLAMQNPEKTVAILRHEFQPPNKNKYLWFLSIMAIRGLNKSHLLDSQKHAHRKEGLATSGSAFWLAWSGLKSISDMLFVLVRISRKFLWVFYVTEVGSTEKLYPPGWYFWKKNSKLLEKGGWGGQERNKWVRIKKAPSGKSHMESRIDSKWDFLQTAAFSSPGQGNKSSHCLWGVKKVWLWSQRLPICASELQPATVRVITKQ